MRSALRVKMKQTNENAGIFLVLMKHREKVNGRDAVATEDYEFTRRIINEQECTSRWPRCTLIRLRSISSISLVIVIFFERTFFVGADIVH